MTILYFAYGSNMCTARLRFRIAACRPVGTATLAGHELRFHKRSRKDGSGKCNALAVADPAARVHGVLFELPEADIGALHRFEGRGTGYDDHRLTVLRPDRTPVVALTYLASADAIDDGLLPYGWYRDFVLGGAAEMVYRRLMSNALSSACSRSTIQTRNGKRRNAPRSWRSANEPFR